MVIKKIPPRAVVVLSPEDQHRVVQVVVLFADVDRRVDGRSVKGRCISANKRKSSEEKGTGLRQKQKNKVRKICGPCFLNQIIYHESVNCKLKNPLKWFDKLTTSGFYIQRDYNDRLHSINIH